MPCVSGGALADGTSACGLRLADQPAPTAPAETIGFVCLGDGKGLRVEEGWAAGWLGEKNVLRLGWPRAREHYLPEKQPQPLNQPQVSLAAHPVGHKQGN